MWTFVVDLVLATATATVMVMTAWGACRIWLGVKVTGDATERMCQARLTA